MAVASRKMAKIDVDDVSDVGRTPKSKKLYCYIFFPCCCVSVILHHFKKSEGRFNKGNQ